MPAVSIVIPMHNAEKSIARTLSCFQNQSFADFEVIVCNDRSNDLSVEIVRSFCASDERFALYDSLLAGAGAARNFGLAKTHGKYIFFFDADDIADAEFLAAFVQAFEKYDADVVISSSKEQEEQSRAVKHVKPFSEGVTCKTIVAQALLLSQMALFATTVAFRRSLLVDEEIRFMEDVSSFEDLPFWLESILSAKRVAFILGSHATYIKHPDQSTRSLTVVAEEFESEIKAIQSMQKRIDHCCSNKKIAESLRDRLDLILTNVGEPHAFVKQLEYLLRTADFDGYAALLNSSFGAHVLASGASRELLKYRHESWFKILLLKHCRCVFEWYYKRHK